MSRPPTFQRLQMIVTAIAAVLPQTLAKEVKPLLAARKRRRGLASRSRAVRWTVEWLHALHLYGAIAVAAFGSAICAVFGWDHSVWVIYWFLGALFIFNVDRAWPDPADEINVPRRKEVTSGKRIISWLAATVAAFFLAYLPFRQADWITLSAVLVGSVACLSYSLPIFKNRRLKEVPLLKTFFAPTIVLLSIFGLPIIHGYLPSSFAVLLLTAVWAWGYMLCNMILCDLRDLRGDRKTGVQSLPVQLGRKATHRLLWILIACTGGLAVLLAGFPGSSARGFWLLMAILGSLYLGGITWAARQRRTERFYEWWVEGMLFVPAVVVAVLR